MEETPALPVHPPDPEQPERILNDRSVSSAAIVNDTALYQALGNETDPCSTAVLVKMGHRAMLSTSELFHLRVVAS